MQKLLGKDPEKRPGVKRMEDLKKDPFFKGIDWEKLARKELKPPKLNPIEDDIEMPVVSLINIE